MCACINFWKLKNRTWCGSWGKKQSIASSALQSIWFMVISEESNGFFYSFIFLPTLESELDIELSSELWDAKHNFIFLDSFYVMPNRIEHRREIDKLLRLEPDNRWDLYPCNNIYSGTRERKSEQTNGEQRGTMALLLRRSKHGEHDNNRKLVNPTVYRTFEWT